MEFLPDPVRTVLAFVLVLGLLVFIHELGHYLAARWRGIHVERFSVGFGRAITAWSDARGTEWRIGWIPLGGYVKLHGQEQPGEVSAEEAQHWRKGETFHDKPVRDRAIVVAAGPIANFALAAVLFAALFATVGTPRTTTQLAVVQENSAAARAGILPGDRIVALDGQRVSRFEEVQRHIQPRAGQEVVVTVLREGAERSFRAVPELRGGGGVLGVGATPAEFERLDPVSALWGGVVQTWDVSRQTLVAVGQMIVGARGTDDLGGPLGIGKIAGDAAELGLASLVTFMAILSVNLALINLFPIPILDGGHLMFYAIEAVRGRPLSPRAQEIGFRAGFALLIALFIFATWNDLARLGLFHWAAGLFG